MEPSSLARGRGKVKASLTKIRRFSETINDQTTLVEIQVRLNALDTLVTQFINYDDLLGEMEGYEYEFDEFGNMVTEVKIVLTREQAARSDNKPKIHNCNNDAANGQSDLVNAVVRLTESQKLLVAESSNTKSSFESLLPKINIKSFNGDYRDWPTFNDQFSKIHSDARLSGIQKFTYLLTLLDPEPLLLIENIPLTNENYVIAWNKLVKRYSNKRKIASSFMDPFFQQKQIKEGTAEEIRNLSDNVENILAGLDAINPTKCRDIWLIYMLLNKLDDHTKGLWAEKTTGSYEKDVQEGKDFATINEFLKFLDVRRATLESVQMQSSFQHTKNSHSQQTKFIVKTKCHLANNKTVCPKCKFPHPLHKCYKFKKDTPQQRIEFVNKQSLCYNCLSSEHPTTSCTSDHRCHACNGKHHTMLHLFKQTAPPQTDVSPKQASDKENQIGKTFNVVVDQSAAPLSHNNNTSSSTTQGSMIIPIGSLLPTAQARVGHPDSGNMITCNILLDSGSQVSFVTEALVQRLKLKRMKSHLNVMGLSSSGSITTKGVVVLKLQSLYDQSEIEVNAFILQSISSNIPEQLIDETGWPILKDLQLADSKFYQPKRMDVLLGADHFFNILRPEQRAFGIGYPTLQNTMFGWVAAGISSNIDKFRKFTSEVYDVSNLHNDLKRFWEIEEINSLTSNLTAEEVYCENHFKSTYRQTNQGRFIVSLPFLAETPQLGESLKSAISRMHSLERRFKFNDNLYHDYKAFIHEYLLLGHIKQIPHYHMQDGSNNMYYLPHHPVIKTDSVTTKCRVVFDGSNKSDTGISLNNKLAVGKTLQRDLTSILLNFRGYKIALIADIEKMYRQVILNETDQNFQRILWRDNPSDSMQHFCLTTVTYGTASAPFLATRCLMQIGLDCVTSNKAVSKVILNDFYVDDLISGANTVEETISLQREVDFELSQRGFLLRKWASNSSSVLAAIPKNASLESLVNFNEQHETIKVLGLHWNSKEDFFTYKVTLTSTLNCTKRNLLSEASKIFDPLGFLSPSIIAVKILFQKLWLLNCGWDDMLPPTISEQWFKIRNSFQQFENLQISRWIGITGTQPELIGFADTSESAYAAVMYIKVFDNESGYHVNLLFSKTKVAPLKQMSIPRLELRAAHLLAKMYHYLSSIPIFNNVKITAFTDSSVVLCWLSSHPRRWKTYVANRASEINEIIPATNWKHINSKQNPADCASRGILPEEF